MSKRTKKSHATKAASETGQSDLTQLESTRNTIAVCFNLIHSGSYPGARAGEVAQSLAFLKSLFDQIGAQIAAVSGVKAEAAREAAQNV